MQPFYLKNFFKRLQFQKLRFNDDLNKQLKSLVESEILHHSPVNSTISEMITVITNHFRNVEKNHFSECYLREYNSWLKYNGSLQNINSGMLRELLIYHRYQFQSTLGELRNIGADKYRI